MSSRKPADCPLPPRPQQTTYSRALHAACVVVGGVAELAAHLGVPAAVLRDWLEGESEPPQAAFLAAVEVVLLHLDTREAPR
jgi:hypothetical protein